MTQATVEKLVQKANELAQKASWVRSGLTKWLEMWKDATATDLKDEGLQRVEVWDRDSAEFYVQTYYLERGYDRVYWLWGEAFERGHWKDEEALDVDDGDMTVLRAVIRRLAGAIEKYIEALDNAGEDYDKLIKLLPAADREPINLTPDFWALPRPGEDAGWVADIINVESQVISTTGRMDTRSAAVVEAHRVAHQMEEDKKTK